jgi:hypothetical protein
MMLAGLLGLTTLMVVLCMPTFPQPHTDRYADDACALCNFAYGRRCIWIWAEPSRCEKCIIASESNYQEQIIRGKRCTRDLILNIIVSL